MNLTELMGEKNVNLRIKVPPRIQNQKIRLGLWEIGLAWQPGAKEEGGIGKWIG